MPIRRASPLRPPGEQGSGSIWVLTVVLVLALAAVSALLLGGAVIARHRAGAAADLAALAAAEQAAGGEDTACATAAMVAAANRARLVSCADDSGVISVGVSGLWSVGPFGPVRASARAGPGR